MLPKVSDLMLITRMRKKKPAIPLMILNARRSVDDHVEGLQIGSDDYLTKPFTFSELFTRRSTGASNPAIMEVEDLSTDLLSRKVFCSAKKIDLRPGEFVPFEYPMRNAGKVVSKTRITEHVRGSNFDPQADGAEARMGRLRDKIDRGFDGQLTETVQGGGYVLGKNS